MKKLYDKTVQALGSKHFFVFVLLLFAAQALWIAFSFRYPMIYDEIYHFGLIEYFSHQWLPWINNQTTDIYGSLGSDPHLLFHYTLSFPFRLISEFSNNLAVEVISMRILNVGLFLVGLLLFNKLFKEMGVKSIFRNITLLFFVLLPAVPFIAATVNYDNAIFPLTALFMIIGMKIIKNKSIDWRQYIWLVLVGMVGVLVKSVFIPIFLAGIVFILVWSWRERGKKFPREFIGSFNKSSIAMRIVILLPVIIIGTIFTEIFGANIVQYQSLSPSCERVLSQERCLSNGIELRNYNLEKNKDSIVPMQNHEYATTWLSQMLATLLWSGSPTNDGIIVFSNPLPVIYAVVLGGGIIGLLAMAYAFSLIKKLPAFWLTVSVIGLYLVALLYINISLYYTYYVPIAIQGRYLLPLLPTVMLFALLGINQALQRKRFLKLPVFVVILMLYLNGAGVIAHIIRSDETWNWDNKQVQEINNSTRDSLRPFIKE